eukprot:TRINITY_DN2023_c0_g1_i4.p1 TRINITY_DN2023_c0_g1~~TRINITY_DN2023_c0_g1_i4.p1  ORF type:complete len:837 (+),score=254.14 TRINITY_DN2023_c0_g1_i4:241-2751(+)
MLAVFVVFWSVVLAAAQKPKAPPCPDIPPTTQFPCEFEVAVGHCEASNNDALKLNGQLVYCLKSCGLCDKVDLYKLPAKIIPRDELAELAKGPGNFAGAQGSASSFSEMVDQIEGNFTSAVADLTRQDLGTGPTRQSSVVEAAVATTQAIATAVASAASSVFVKGVTNSANSKAAGLAKAQAESIANATASAYAVALAEAGQEFTELEASIMVNDVQKALTSASADFKISGVTEVTAQFNAYSEAVAEALANATARAFAKITGFEYSAIAFAAAQAFNSTEIPCLSICNNVPPPTELDKTCQDYVESDQCGEIVGFCECECGTCQIGSEAYVSSFTNIISNDDSQQVVNALGEAFSQGAKGADAVASAFVEAVSQGKAEAVSTAIAEAFGAQEISSTAMAEAVTIAINEGGDEVTSAVADAFALAERGGNSEALAEAIAISLTSEDADDAQAVAMSSALATAITDLGCEAISIALTEAEALAESEGDGPAFASAVSVSDTINSCLSSFKAPEGESQAVTEVETVAQGGNSISTAQALAENLCNNQIRASVDAIAKSVSEGNSEAVAKGLGIAFSEGAPTQAIVQAISVAINEGTNQTVVALADAFAQAENSYSDALSQVLAQALLEGGEDAEAMAAVVSSAISADGCEALAKSLASALAQAEAEGRGQAIVQVLPEEAAECVDVSGGMASSVANAVVNGGDEAVLVLAAQAIQDDQIDEFLKGLEEAKLQGGSCENINDVLLAVVQLNGSHSIPSAIQQHQPVVDCLGDGLKFCPGLVGRDCCASGDFPEQCRCTRFTCRTTKNQLLSIPELGLYVYNDVGNRQCKCPINVSAIVD